MALQSSAMKECPMCGEIMRLTVRETHDGIPGRGETKVRQVREWICPECDYFEEAESGEG
jgi:C4-type Zn-finger protein